MSLTNNIRDYSNDFPIGDSIKRVYLKSVKYKEGIKNSKAFQKISFSFLRGKEWIHLTVTNPRKEYYEDEDSFRKEKLRTEEILAMIQACYLSKNEMKLVFLNSKGFREYCKNFREAMNKKNFWNIELEVKTVRNKDKNGAIFPYFANFIKRKGDSTVNIKYTTWEKNNT